jgi:hypothetical protein
MARPSGKKLHPHDFVQVQAKFLADRLGKVLKMVSHIEPLARVGKEADVRLHVKHPLRRGVGNIHNLNPVGAGPPAHRAFSGTCLPRPGVDAVK